MEVFLSNDLEALANHLMKNVFSQPSLFSQKWIVVPSIYQKNYINLFLVRSPKQIALGSHFIEQSAITHFFEKTICSQKQNYFPTLLELFFKFSQLITVLRMENKDNGLFNDLWAYLKWDENNSKEALDRLYYVSFELAKVFHEMAFDHFDFSKLNSWQKELIIKMKNQNPQFLNIKDIIQEKPNKTFAEVHFFNCRYIEPEILSILSKNQITQVHYVLSPSSYYWIDSCSKKQKYHLHKEWSKKTLSIDSQKQMQSYLNEENPLLSALGKLSNEYLKTLIDLDGNLYENYLSPLQNKLTLLNQIQEDLLSFYVPYEQEKRKLNFEEDSLKIYEATSKRREVEIAFDEICYALQYENIKPNEIKIYAPQIEDYASLIEEIFYEQKIPIQIKNLSLKKESHLIRGLNQFFSLIHSRWEKTEICELLENICIREKFFFSKQEINFLKVVFDEASIEWGLTEDHVLQKTQSSKNIQFCWENGLKRILEASLYYKEEESIFKSKPALLSISKTEMDVIERFLNFFDQLKRDLLWIEQNSFVSIQEMLLYCRSIIDKYFYFEQNHLYEGKAFSLIESFLQKMEKNSLNFSNTMICSSHFIKMFQEELETSHYTVNSWLANACVFQSLREGAIETAKMIYVLGLQENYPQNGYESLLSYRIDKIDTSAQKEKDLFLQIVLLAKNKLICSYIKSETQDKSPLLHELKLYLENTFEKSCLENVFFRHKKVPFDEFYFSQDNFKKQFSSVNYAIALKKNKTPYILKTYSEEIQQEEIQKVEIKDLIAFSQHPIKFYYNKILNVYFEKDEKKGFYLSGLDRYKLYQFLLGHSFNDLDHFMEKELANQTGPLKQFWKKLVQAEASEIEKKIDQLSLRQKERFSLNFNLSRKKIEKVNETYYLVPPIEILLNNKSIYLVGSLDDFTQDGPIFYADKGVPDQLKNWPKVLISNYLNKENYFSFKKIFQVKSGGTENLMTTQTEDFAHYIEYYLASFRNPSFLIPQLANDLMEKNFNSFEKHYNQLVAQNDYFEDPYLQKASLLYDTFDKRLIFEEMLQRIQKPFNALMAQNADV
jgi:exonuclease V gamma subunit